VHCFSSCILNSLFTNYCICLRDHPHSHRLRFSTSTMESLTIFICSLSLLFGALVNAGRLAEPAVQVHARSLYQGGWPLALMASESTGCPAEAPVQCQNSNTLLECCPSGQICHIDATNGEQYCCPTGPSTPPLLFLIPLQFFGHSPNMTSQI
jgi:hypothetical protein